MTGFYMSRMWFMTFAGEPRNELIEHVHEATPWIKTPLVVLSVMTALGGFGLAVYGAVEFLSAEADYLSLHGHTLLEQIIHEVEHAFLPEDMQLRYVGWVTILLAFIIGPIMAARIYGGALKEGEQAIPLVHWLTSLSGKFGSQNVDDLANSELAEALQQRLYFDDLYEGILARTIVPFAAFAAWFDANVIDGAIKQIESKSVLGSVQIRRVTTGSARDYILMAAIGALSIFALIWGVNA
jgi:NADH-quinone oxidoreductase subunit L